MGKQTILICEENLSAAVTMLLKEAKFPRPLNWTATMDEFYIREAVLPAFLRALGEIGDVQTCAGFDLANCGVPTWGGNG